MVEGGVILAVTVEEESGHCLQRVEHDRQPRIHAAGRSVRAMVSGVATGVSVSPAKRSTWIGGICSRATMGILTHSSLVDRQ
jgi:hypothetical protein